MSRGTRVDRDHLRFWRKQHQPEAELPAINHEPAAQLGTVK